MMHTATTLNEENQVGSIFIRGLQANLQETIANADPSDRLLYLTIGNLQIRFLRRIRDDVIASGGDTNAFCDRVEASHAAWMETRYWMQLAIEFYEAELSKCGVPGDLWDQRMKVIQTPA